MAVVMPGANRVLPRLGEHLVNSPDATRPFDQFPLALVEPDFFAVRAVVEAIGLVAADAVLAHQRAALRALLRADGIGRLGSRARRSGVA